jgi:hypothetical protein
MMMIRYLLVCIVGLLTLHSKFVGYFLNIWGQEIKIKINFQPSMREEHKDET